VTGVATRSLAAVTHVPPRSLEAGERTFASRAPIDHARALAQHDAYCDTLLALGCEVITLDVNAEFPDAVFVEDTAVVLDEVAVLALPGAPSRRGEVPGIAGTLARYRPLARISLPGTLDGGDVVRVGRTLLVGASTRTNADGARGLAEIGRAHGYTVGVVPIRDCLHLKSACCPLPDGRLLVNARYLPTDGLAGFDLVQVPAEEPHAADVLTVGNDVILSASHPRTADLIRGLGFEVHALEVSEFEKAEGGVTCLSLIFSR